MRLESRHLCPEATPSADCLPVSNSAKWTSHAIRVLLTCIALALAMPAATSGVHGELSASIVAQEHSAEAPRELGSRAANARLHSYPTREIGREPARAQICPSEVGVRTRCAFLLNCSWLC